MMARWPDDRLQKLFGIEHPVLQAPMAGCSTPAMAAAVGNAGGMGALGCAMMSEDVIRNNAREIRQASNAGFNLNFFCHAPPVLDAKRAQQAQKRLQPWFERFDLGDVPDMIPTHHPFDRQICDVVLDIAPTVASFHFGLPDAELVQSLRDAGIIILSSATSVAEARWLASNGADAVIAQGVEAGGHNGWFLPRDGADVSTTFGLVPRIVDAIDVPVIAAGGISDGRGIAAAFALGAAGVQIGTAFVASNESSVSNTHKHAVIQADGDTTVATRAFSGRSARGLNNRFISEMAQDTDWPDFPLMNTATAPLRGASAKAGSPDAIAMWAGQGVGLATGGSAHDIFTDLIQDAQRHLT